MPVQNLRCNKPNNAMLSGVYSKQALQGAIQRLCQSQQMQVPSIIGWQLITGGYI